MPFIEKADREKLVIGAEWEKPGELRYLQYLPMMRKWRASRRWTTVHQITKDMFDIDDHKAAKLLAWFVFMADEAMEYEKEKKAENGEV